MPVGSDSGFQPISNPYIVGKPIEDKKMFFGREDDFAYIKKKVTGGKKGGMIVLCGTRRSGKTSILFQIKGGRLGDEFIPVLIDMQSMTVQSDGEFLGKLALEIIAALGDPDLSFEHDFHSRSGDNPFAVFQDLINKIGTKLQGRKLVLMFDEYELFETHIDKGRFSTDILNTLANWMEHREGVFIVFTGSDNLESRKSTYWEHFLGKALHRKISFLSKSDTLRLIHEPVEGVVLYEEGVPELIYDLTAGQPFYSQVLCQTLVDHLNEIHKYEVDPEDIKQAVSEIIENPLPQMIFAWSSLSDLEKLSLSITGELSKDEAKFVPSAEILSYSDEESIGYRVDPNKLREATERLFHHDLLEKDTQGDSYTFKMDLWRQWMMRMHSIWQVVNELGESEDGLEEGIVPTAPRHRGVSRFRTWSAVAAIALIAGFAFIYTNYLRPGRNTSYKAVAVIPDSTLITIKTEPGGAQIILGDNILGSSPIDSRAVQAGLYTLRIVKRGYKDLIDTLELRKDEPLEKSYSLVLRTGNLEIHSEPPGAIIYINDNRTEHTTPATIENLAVTNLYKVRLGLEGYIDGIYHSIEVYEDSTIVIRHPFDVTRHSLRVESNPIEASIYLDGRPYGLTPNSLSEIKKGRYLLEVKKDGYADFRQTINVPRPGNKIEITLAELPPGKIVFHIIPFARLFINGELYEDEATFMEIPLKQGIYYIELRNPTLGTFRDTVRVNSEETETKEYNLYEMRK